MRQWIMESDQEVPTYLVRFDREGELHGWQHADLSGVLDVLGDQAYADAMGEDSDVIAVFVLTDVAPVLVKITQVAHRPVSLVEVVLSWRTHAGKASETGYRKMMEV